MRANLKEQVEEMARAMNRPRFLHVVATLLVHERTKTGIRCPCCDSRTAEIIETLEVADLVIDLLTGDRLLAADMDDQSWVELCGLAKLEVIQFRCSQHQKPLILDETSRHQFASGGNRSSKTTAGMIWISIQWLRHGGRERRFWLCSSTSKKAHELLCKIFRGTGESPRVLSPDLYTYSPSTHRSGNQQTRMIDGSIWDLKSYDGDPEGERLKSDAIVAALVDEAAHLAGKEPLDVLRGRCMDAGGRLFLASTATPDSFLLDEVVTPALVFARLPDGDDLKNPKHPGSRWNFAKFPLIDNPWIPQENIERELATMDPEDPSVLRNYYGEWITSTGPLWSMFLPGKHILPVHEARVFEDLGMEYRVDAGAANHKDITSECVTLLFGQMSPHYKGVRATNRRYVLGTDVNCHPMSSCVISITAPADNPKDRDKWHFWCWDVVRTAHGNSFAHVEELGSDFFGRILSPGSKTSPLAGCGVIIDAQALGRDPTAHKFGGDPTGIAQLFGRKGFDVRAPRYISVEKKGRVPVPPSRMDSYLLTQRVIREGRLHVSNRSSSLLESFVQQQDAGNGWEPIKNDRLSSPIDGLRYALWALVHADKPATIRQ